MRSIPLLVALAALSLVAVAGAEEETKKSKAKPPPEGIWWAQDFQAGLARAAREGRPVLFCVNALETEQANQRLGLNTYRSAAWGQATRGYVNFVCNPEDHGATACSRYERHVCKGHRDALTWFLKRFGQDLISPQHVILEPDGDVAFRKEYYTGVVEPALLEGYLSNVAPPIAYARAGIGREAKLKSCADLPLPELDAFASKWLAGRDGLAAAAMLNALDDCYDAPRRLALISALAHTHDLQAPVLVIAAEERMLYPTDEPAETLAWLKTLFRVDRSLGVWGATRALVRLEDEAVRSAVLRIWAGADGEGSTVALGDLPAAERSSAYEALLLAKDRRASQAKVPADWVAGRAAEIARARRVTGRVTGAATVDLAAALKDAYPGNLRTALLAASPAAVRPHAEALMQLVNKHRAHRVRLAAAMALWKARAGPPVQLIDVLYGGSTDLIEGRPTNEALGALMPEAGLEVAHSREAWNAAMLKWWKDGAK